MYAVVSFSLLAACASGWSTSWPICVMKAQINFISIRFGSKLWKVSVFDFGGVTRYVTNIAIYTSLTKGIDEFKL